MKQNRTTNTLEELVRLMNLQDERVLAMYEGERKSGFVNPALDRTIRTQKELLRNILELLFDLGLEDCKRHMWEHIVMVEKRRAEESARVWEVYLKAQKIFKEHFAKGSQVAASSNARIMEAEANEAPDANGTDNRAEPVDPLAPAKAVAAESVLEKLADLLNLQDQRVLALHEEENKLGFINPRLDSAISLHKELLLSFQRMAFDLALDRYQRRTPREQVAEFWEQEQRNQKIVREVYTAAKEAFKPQIKEHGTWLRPDVKPDSAQVAESSIDPSARAEEDERDVP